MSSTGHLGTEPLPEILPRNNPLIRPQGDSLSLVCRYASHLLVPSEPKKTHLNTIVISNNASSQLKLSNAIQSIRIGKPPNRKTPPVLTPAGPPAAAGPGPASVPPFCRPSKASPCCSSGPVTERTPAPRCWRPERYFWTHRTGTVRGSLPDPAAVRWAVR